MDNKIISEHKIPGQLQEKQEKRWSISTFFQQQLKTFNQAISVPFQYLAAKIVVDPLTSPLRAPLQSAMEFLRLSPEEALELRLLQVLSQLAELDPKDKQHLEKLKAKENLENAGINIESSSFYTLSAIQNLAAVDIKQLPGIAQDGLLHFAKEEGQKIAPTFSEQAQSFFFNIKRKFTSLSKEEHHEMKLIAAREELSEVIVDMVEHPHNIEKNLNQILGNTENLLAVSYEETAEKIAEKISKEGSWSLFGEIKYFLFNKK